MNCKNCGHELHNSTRKMILHNVTVYNPYKVKVCGQIISGKTKCYCAKPELINK